MSFSMAMNIVINMNLENYCYQLLYVTCLLNDVGSNENDKIVELLDVSSNQSIKVIPYFVNDAHCETRCLVQIVQCAVLPTSLSSTNT